MSTISKEQLRERAREKVKSLEFAVTQTAFADSRAELEEELELARIALASLEAEPVAWRSLYYENHGLLTGSKNVLASWQKQGWECEPLYTAPPAPVSVPDYPETLPCPVMLEPGLRFGKGVHTKTVLDALQRRAEYHAELEAMTPEQRAEHDAGMKEFAAMLQGAESAESRCTIQAAPALDSSPKNTESRCGNSPVIPERWENCKHLLPIGELIHRLEEQTGDKWICVRDAISGDLISAIEEVLRISDRDHDAWHRARAAIAKCRQQ